MKRRAFLGAAAATIFAPTFGRWYRRGSGVLVPIAPPPAPANYLVLRDIHGTALSMHELHGIELQHIGLTGSSVLFVGPTLHLPNEASVATLKARPDDAVVHIERHVPGTMLEGLPVPLLVERGSDFRPGMLLKLSID